MLFSLKKLVLCKRVNFLLHTQTYINMRKPEIVYEKSKIRCIVFSPVAEG